MSQSADDLIPEQRRLEHLREMSAYAAEDSRLVHLRVTASLALGVLYLTQLPFARLVALPQALKICLLGGLLALIGSAVCYFEYTTTAHHARRAIATAILNGDTTDAAEWWNSHGPWKKRWWAFRCGDVLLLVGASLLGVVLADLLKI